MKLFEDKLISMKCVVIMITCLIVQNTLIAQSDTSDPVDIFFNVKTGISDFTIELQELTTVSDQYIGRNFTEYKNQQSQPGLFTQIEVEIPIENFRLTAGLGWSLNEITYENGYEPVGLVNDTLPHNLSNRFMYRSLTNVFKVGYSLGQKISFIPSLGIINTRLDNTRYEVMDWDPESRQVFEYTGSIKSQTLLAWNTSWLVELAIQYAINEKWRLGATYFFSQTLVNNTERIGSGGISRIISYAEYNRVGYTVTFGYLLSR